MPPLSHCFLPTLYLLICAVLVHSGFQGNEFLLAFPTSRPIDSSFEQRLSMANVEETNITVKIMVVKNSTTFLTAQLQLDTGQGCLSQCINDSLIIRSSKVIGYVVKLIATGRIVVLVHSVSAGSDFGNFLAVPTSSLSQTYLALATCDTGSCVLIVVGTSMKMDVNITFCLHSKTSPAYVVYYNTSYGDGSNLNVALNPWDTIEIVTDGVSLDGTLVKSSGKIAVFSGTLSILNNNISNFNIEEIVPLNQLGTEYVVVDSPASASTTYVKVIYTRANTTLAIDPKDLTLKTKGNCVEYYTLKQHGSAILRSDMPILVQLIYASNDNLIITPTQNWATYYVTITSSPSNVLLITAANCSSYFSFNGVVESGLSWTLVGDNSFKFADKSVSSYGTWLSITAQDCAFSGIVYSPTKSNLLWSLGWGPDSVLATTTINSRTTAMNTTQIGTQFSTTISTPLAITSTNITAITTASSLARSLFTSSLASTTSSMASSTLNNIKLSTLTSTPASIYGSTLTTTNPSTDRISLSTLNTTTLASISTTITSSSLDSFNVTTASLTSSKHNTTNLPSTSAPTFSYMTTNFVSTSSTTSNASLTLFTTLSSVANTSSSQESNTTAAEISTNKTNFATAVSTTAASTLKTTNTTTKSYISLSSTKAELVSTASTSSNLIFSSGSNISTIIPVSETTLMSSPNALMLTSSTVSEANHPITWLPEVTSQAMTSDPTSELLTTADSVTSTREMTRLHPSDYDPDNMECPCSCYYSSNLPNISQYLQHKDALSQDIIDYLKLRVADLSARKSLKLSAENVFLSETVVGATVSVLLSAIVLFFMSVNEIGKFVYFIKVLFGYISGNKVGSIA